MVCEFYLKVVNTFEGYGFVYEYQLGNRWYRITVNFEKWENGIRVLCEISLFLGDAC